MPNPNASRQNGPGPVPGPGEPHHRVAGLFSKPDGVARAVERLQAQSVPADEIDVYAIDDEGRRTRRIIVEDESGTLKGAVIGAVVGAALALVIMLLSMADVFGDWAGGWANAGWLNLLQVMAAAAAMGVPIGAVIGMGHWQGKKKMVTRDFGQGAVMVVVESDEMSDVARRVLRDAGADRVSG
jgi:NADH:ubiquinone oxidoreductase subunit F (NADH-binding)